MKKTHSITLLILLVLCVTIAGAYATWSYTTATNVDPITKNISVNLADKNVTTVDGGTLAVTGDITASIDDSGNYKADLVMGGNGFVVTYTNDTTPDAKISMQATITVTSASYNNADVITVKTATIYSAEATNQWTITPAMIRDCLTIADISLPTVAAYDAFNDAMDAGTTAITVTIAAVAE